MFPIVIARPQRWRALPASLREDVAGVVAIAGVVLVLLLVIDLFWFRFRLRSRA